jgi:hypothetical protein
MKLEIFEMWILLLASNLLVKMVRVNGMREEKSDAPILK